MSGSFFPMIARMRYINRWGLMRNTDTENIQEHSHQVAVLAHALAVIRSEKFGGTVDPGAVAVAALYHDASEILTGDLPTPIKYYNPAIRDAYKQVGLNIEAGKFTPVKEVCHTHEGSIGNLCNDQISALMQNIVDGFAFNRVNEAEQQLLSE